MAKSKAEKTQEVEQLAELLSKAKGVYLTDFTNMSVEAMNLLRRRCREADVSYRVVKKSLMKRAAAEVGMKELEREFEGPAGLAVSYEDELAPARIVSSFRKESGLPEIKAGIVEGVFYDSTQVVKLASLPPKPELIAQFMAVAQGPVRGLAVVLQGTVRKLLYALKAVADKQQSPEA